MHTVIAWTAQDLLWVMVVAFAVVWVVLESRRGKVEVGAQAVVGLALALVLMYAAKSVHHDPRPFVADPGVRPLFGHSRDDGFPSDHSVAASLIAALIVVRHRIPGLVMAAAAVAIAWARVAAHVHHLQDVVAGLLLGSVAAAIAIAVTRPVLAGLAQRSEGLGRLLIDTGQSRRD
ncbi:MAG: phosphatase PAP2 family protein [Jatrophihabitans sp.]|uniref:phosphatase PAP2 family protein n=1 Tax=Jatrophihabitans sp. TaxID=1932789 RepID=UPI003F7D807E